MRFEARTWWDAQRGEYDPLAMENSLKEWATCKPMRALDDISGWVWPEGRDTLVLLDQLAALSADWDFQSASACRTDRDHGSDVERELPEATIMAAVRELGLVDSVLVSPQRFSHLIVLAGLVRGCVNRTHLAARLIGAGLAVDTVVALGAHRQLSPDERKLAGELGLGELDDEAEVIMAAARQAFELGPPPFAEGSGLVSAQERPEAFHAASARFRWPSLEVVIAPSSQPTRRRASTADQLQYWVDTARQDIGHEALILTTQIYVPYQHMETVRVLGLNHGCRVYSYGVDSTNALLPVEVLSGKHHLQAVRAALCAAPALLRTARAER